MNTGNGHGDGGVIVHQCYITTDDDDTLVVDIKRELKRANIPCGIYSLVTSSTPPMDPTTRQDRGVIRQDDYRLWVDWKILSQTTYFIGTLDSNFSALVALMRACRFSNG